MAFWRVEKFFHIFFIFFFLSGFLGCANHSVGFEKIYTLRNKYSDDGPNILALGDDLLLGEKELYQPGENRSTQLPESFSKSQRGRIVTHKGKVFKFGYYSSRRSGTSESKILDSNGVVYDPKNNTVAQLTELPRVKGKDSVILSLDNGNLLLVGGDERRYLSSDIPIEYRSDKGLLDWDKIYPLIKVLRDKYPHDYNDILEFNPKTKNMEIIAKLPARYDDRGKVSSFRRHAVIPVEGSKFLILGGWHDQGDEIYLLDKEKNTLVLIGHLSVPLSYPNGIQISDKEVLLGGGKLNISGVSWIKEVKNKKRAHMYAEHFSTENSLYTEGLPVFQILNIETQKIVELNDLKNPREDRGTSYWLFKVNDNFVLGIDWHSYAFIDIKNNQLKKRHLAKTNFNEEAYISGCAQTSNNTVYCVMRELTALTRNSYRYSLYKLNIL